LLNFKTGTSKPKRKFWKAKLFNESLGSCTITNDGTQENPYFTIYLKLNENSRGKGFGWKSFAAVSALSRIDIIHAEAAKKNKPSIGALKKAGYIESDEPSAQFNCVYTSTGFELIRQDIFINAVPLSFWVDFVSLLTNPKREVIRTVLANDLDSGSYIVDGFGFFMNIDDEGYAVIGYNSDLCQKVLKIDQSIGGNDIIGSYFGYPDCCMNIMEGKSESDIDDYDAQLMKKVSHSSLIQTSNYMNGDALISHVPCSSQCGDSILLGEKNLEFLKRYGLKTCAEIKSMCDC